MNSKYTAFDRSRLRLKPLAERVHDLQASHWMRLEDAAPPFDHPHVFLDLGNDNEIICPYCSTLYRFAADLKAGEARPPECVVRDKVA